MFKTCREDLETTFSTINGNITKTFWKQMHDTVTISNEIWLHVGKGYTSI